MNNQYVVLIRYVNTGSFIKKKKSISQISLDTPLKDNTFALSFQYYFYPDSKLRTSLK